MTNLKSSSERVVSPPTKDMTVASAMAAIKASRLAIEAVTPVVDGGRYPVRRIVGDTVHVKADAYGEGHDPIAVALRWRSPGATDWRETRMQPIGNDRWAADFKLDTLGRYHFTVEAWRDEFAIFRGQLLKKVEAGLGITLELEEGRRLIERIAGKALAALSRPLRDLVEALTRGNDADRLQLLLADETRDLMLRADPRIFPSRMDYEQAVESERREAVFASWYELFPRSQSGDATRHGTFDDVARRLPAIQAMEFDVVYFPPIHPIGWKNRKGRNNSLVAAPDDPGSPYAIGSSAGGHDAIHPALGTFDDFERLLGSAKDLGLEIALDLAIQASPDHPWLGSHPEWFDWRPDGTIRYAENPPKTYEDIVNVDFYADGAKPALWMALRDVVFVWIDHGIRLFRVDNPHTKPFPFWEWLIAEVRSHYPDVVFLSEAFTRPKVMYRLAKLGFSQSYTYFTWRNTKAELQDYFTELSTEAPKEFFRPHLFVNTHDINPDFLHDAPRPAFLIRAALATTLSGLWGMYNGFELCEGRPDAKKKEYADSEKYQLTAWDWSKPGNIIAEITALNEIRRRNPALQTHLGVTFLKSSNEQVLFFEKATPSRDNVLLIAICLDAYGAQETDIEVPLNTFGPDVETIAVEDLMTGKRFDWSGPSQRIRLDPNDMPFALWRISRAEHAE